MATRTIKQVRFVGAFPLYGPQAATKTQWNRDATNKEGKKKTEKGMVAAPDLVAEDSIGVVFTVWDKNGNCYVRRCPWARVDMVEYEES